MATITEKSGRIQKVPKMGMGEGKESEEYEKYPELSVGTRQVEQMWRTAYNQGQENSHEPAA